MSQKTDIILIHGGNSYTTHQAYIDAITSYNPRYRDGYVSWKSHINGELEQYYDVYQPQMPSKDNAKFDEWKIVFDKVLDTTHKNSILIGHSLGANFLTHYLSKYTPDKHIKQIHLISGCIAEGDFKEPKDWDAITQQCSDIHLWHSEDDPVVPYQEAVYMDLKLVDSTLHTFKDRKHFNQPYFPELVSHLISNHPHTTY
jgi:predicted alpha/beta hydrolase family esterase